MVRIRHRWLVTSLALGALGLGISSCKKDEKKADPTAPGGAPAGDTAGGGATAEKPAGAPGIGAGDAIAMLPSTSEFVMGVNIAQLAQTPLWKKFVEPSIAKSRAEMAQKMGDFKAKCGFDPMDMATAGSIVVGVRNMDSDAVAVVVVKGAPDKTKAIDCVGKMKDEIAKNGGEVSVDGDVVTLKNPKENVTIVAKYAAPTTVVATIGKTASKADLDAALAGTSSLTTSKSFMSYYSKLDTSHSLWGVVNGKAKAFDMMGAMMGAKAEIIYGSINVTDGVVFDVRMKFASDAEAAQVAKAANASASMAKGMVQEMKIASEGPEVKTVVRLTPQNLETMGKQFGGMMMGGHGGGM